MNKSEREELIGLIEKKHFPVLQAGEAPYWMIVFGNSWKDINIAVWCDEFPSRVEISDCEGSQFVGYIEDIKDMETVFRLVIDWRKED